MKVFRDYNGLEIRLSKERRDHVLSHPELEGHEDWIADALLNPEELRLSTSDPSVKLYYLFSPAPERVPNGSASWSRIGETMLL
ncbi:MAG: hypothetical protein COV67_04115 [Nitrospinae bacterium CG11_big_fil_rev_8_21_14_0_20_56_8]|nr:MAG: hypothetical protein COV67_04115 [Nitrospinae bacterium CG11_big_fil_rev_8_21_14_0_20_56_8]